jgi:hypothetical protein
MLVARQRVHVYGQVAFSDLGDHLGRVLRLATELVHQGPQHLPGHQRHDKHQHCADGQQDGGVAPEGVFDVVHIVAKADDPVPRLELDDGVELVHRLLGAGAGAGGRHRAHGHALQSGAVPHTRLLAALLIDDADALGIGVHVVHVVREAPNKEVFVLVYKTADGLGSLFDGIFARERAALLFLVRLLSGSVCQNHQIGELRGALFHH